MDCIVCETNLEWKEPFRCFCTACVTALQNDPPAYLSKTTLALTLYQDPFANIIKMIKIFSHKTILDEFLRILSLREDVVAFCENLDFITSIAPSMYSRFFLRTDVSYHFAHFVTSCHPYLMVKNHNLWWTKQSFQTSRETNPQILTALSNLPLCRTLIEDKKKVLIVDDVITTGYSMLEMASQLRAYRCKFLAISIAPSLVAKLQGLDEST